MGNPMHYESIRMGQSTRLQRVKRQNAQAYTSKKEGIDQELIQSSNTPDPRQYMRKFAKHMETLHTRRQEVRPFPAGDHKAARNREISLLNTKVKHK